MRPYELPQITESSPVEEQLRQIKSFLYRQAENLNYNLKSSDIVSIWKQTAEALSVSSNDEVEEMRRDEFKALRSLIIKSATSIIKNEDTFSANLSGNYTAESDYGTFSEEGSIYINGNPYTIGQVYKYQAKIVAEAAGLAGNVAEVVTYKTDMEGFIRTGVLERETSKPVFGMEIGYNKNTYTVDGVEYQNNSPAKVRITPLRIGLWQNGFEAAYIENKAIYFPAAHITGGSINLNDKFTVDTFGNMVAKSAVIEGTVRAGAGFIGGFEIRGSSSQEGNYWPCSFSSILTPTDGNENDDYQYVVFMRGNYTESGENYGAIDTTHNVFGIKKRKKSVTKWDNDVAPYVYSVTVKGEVTCASLTTDKIIGSYFKVNSDNVQIGSNSYNKPIYLLTSDEIRIGTFKNKASDIYLLASDTVRIGQYGLASEGNDQTQATDAPSTANVKIQAKTLFEVGSNGYKVAEVKMYAGKAFIYASSTQFDGLIAPTADTGADLGYVSDNLSRRWKYIYSKYLTISSDGCWIGTKESSDAFAGPINIQTSGDMVIDANSITFKDAGVSSDYTYAQIIGRILNNKSRLDAVEPKVEDKLNISDYNKFIENYNKQINQIIHRLDLLGG